MSTTEFSAECLRIAQLYDRTPDVVQYYMELHDVVQLPLCRTPYDGFGAFVSDLTATVNVEPSLTRQEFTDMSDPNWIIDRHAKGQDISMFLNPRQPVQGDFSDMPQSFHEIMNITVQARQQFADLPESIRSQFGNNPIAFVDFIMDPKNAEKLIEMGLFEKPAVVTPLPVVIQSPAQDTTGGGEGA